MSSTPMAPDSEGADSRMPDGVARAEVPGITLVSELGNGGFGTVYLGKDTVLCSEEHYWETFAAGAFSEDVNPVEYDTLWDDPDVIATCRLDVLEDYVGRRAHQGARIEVYWNTPDVGLGGAFRCISNEGRSTF